jgi:molecular chaperone GrpE (heat shock protein)
MKDDIKELEKLITVNLHSISELNNKVEQKELEMNDLLKSISIGIINAIDSFEQVEEAFVEKGQDKIQDVARTMQRYKSVKTKLINLLNQHGITKIDFPDNRLIIGLCEVVDTVVDNTRKNDEISTIVRNGYIRGKELIRAAQIIVIKN